MFDGSVDPTCECVHKLPCTFVTCCCSSTKERAGSDGWHGAHPALTGTHLCVSAALICMAQEEIANLCRRKDLQPSEPGKGNAFRARKKKTQVSLTVITSELFLTVNNAVLSRSFPWAANECIPGLQKTEASGTLREIRPRAPSAAVTAGCQLGRQRSAAQAAPRRTAPPGGREQSRAPIDRGAERPPGQLWWDQTGKRS